MSDISVLLGEAGAPQPAVEFRGKEYAARPLTQARKAAWVRWLKTRAYEDLAVVRDTLGPEEFRRRDQDLQAAIDAGEYGFFGRRSLQALQSPEGAVRFTALVFDCSEDEAVALAAACGEEVGAALARAVRESFPSFPEGPGPNAQAPARPATLAG